jgi:hypothetical protein
MSQLRRLEALASDKDFQAKWRAVKMVQKKQLAAKIKEITGDDVNTDALFDIHVSSCCCRSVCMLQPCKLGHTVAMAARRRETT